MDIERAKSTLEQGRRPERLQIDAGKPGWIAVCRKIVDNPTFAKDVHVLELNVGSIELVVEEEDIAFLIQNLSLTQVPSTLSYEDDCDASWELVIMTFFLSMLPGLTEAHLRLSGSFDNRYFQYFGPNDLRTLKILSLEYLWSNRVIDLEDCFRLSEAAPNIEKIKTKGCGCNTWTDDKSTSNVRELRFINASLYRDEMNFFNRCPQLHILYYSFDFALERFVFDGQFQNTPTGGPVDLLEAVRPLRAQLKELSLGVGKGSPHDDLVRIDSLADFNVLKVVSIAVEFISDIPPFFASLPGSVTDLTVVGHEIKVCEAFQHLTRERSLAVKHVGCKSDQCVSRELSVLEL
ncbi:hypothetical protein ColTof3_08482 [Colletotrichum tofieldiae]|nr:hypothetical protein ColTof3_08482 [Colletotrichum tofieldiae]